MVLPSARCGVAEMFHGLAAEPAEEEVPSGTNGFMLVVVLPNRLRSCTRRRELVIGIGEPNVGGGGNSDEVVAS